MASKLVALQIPEEIIVALEQRVAKTGQDKATLLLDILKSGLEQLA